MRGWGTRHFQRSRPAEGACLLDFYEVWLLSSLRARDEEGAYKWAREIAHWAMLMHPEFAPVPHNVVLGDN
jgi:hypothetical protein